MRYKVVDYYENNFGDEVFVSDDLELCLMFCREYEHETDGVCLLRVYDRQEDMEVRYA